MVQQARSERMSITIETDTCSDSVQEGSNKTGPAAVSDEQAVKAQAVKTNTDFKSTSDVQF
ncbi:unnamed protein product [Arabis nemorensis]|uniref:Uncharacterized protein n=1 Tax=Arabis nemorensis TaxID=586526 RepID=A0A565AY18_9BRAS|nr:unnamed protein product [Arabis nemorensis]